MKFYNLWKDCGRTWGYFTLFGLDYDLVNKYMEIVVLNFQVCFVWGD